MPILLSSKKMDIWKLMKMMKMKMPSEGGSSLILGVFFDTGDIFQLSRYKTYYI